jgi:rSAM/selenodomain-associated transferase 2
MRLSVVIPALDESARIAACVAQILTQPSIDEVLVVDGGSSDATAALARSAGARVLAAPRGRARQLNAGAAAARGDTLLFLHADVALPPGAASIIDAILQRKGVVAGAFRTWHVPERRRGRGFRLLLHLADVRSRYSPLPYGDQALFLRAETFAAVGGFPPMDLMEDLEMSRRLGRLGRIAVASQPVTVSGRRFEQAPLYQTLLVNVFPLLYALGVSPTLLARLYGDPR